MAKVYDALKRIEMERSQRTAEPVGPDEPVSPSLWKRWFVPQPEPQVGHEGPTHTGDLLLERIKLIFARLDALENMRAEQSASNVDERLQLIDAKLAALEHDLVKRMSDVADQLTQTTAQLKTRVWVLCGLTGLALIALLFRV